MSSLVAITRRRDLCQRRSRFGPGSDRVLVPLVMYTPSSGKCLDSVYMCFLVYLYRGRLNGCRYMCSLSVSLFALCHMLSYYFVTFSCLQMDICSYHR
jgi:hypothetical protein